MQLPFFIHLKSINMKSDNSNGRLAEIKDFVKEQSCWKVSVNLFQDFKTTQVKVIMHPFSADAPLSLGFVIIEKDRFMLNVGFIFHENMTVLEMVGHPHFPYHSHRIKLLPGQYIHNLKFMSEMVAHKYIVELFKIEETNSVLVVMPPVTAKLLYYLIGLYVKLKYHFGRKGMNTM